MVFCKGFFDALWKFQWLHACCFTCIMEYWSFDLGQKNIYWKVIFLGLFTRFQTFVVLFSVFGSKCQWYQATCRLWCRFLVLFQSWRTNSVHNFFTLNMKLQSLSLCFHEYVINSVWHQIFLFILQLLQ